MIIVAPQAPRMVNRFGANRVVGSGLGILAVGAFLLSRVGVDSGYWAIFSAMVVMVAGMSVGTRRSPMRSCRGCPAIAPASGRR